MREKLAKLRSDEEDADLAFKTYAILLRMWIGINRARPPSARARAEKPSPDSDKSTNMPMGSVVDSRPGSPASPPAPRRTDLGP